MSGDSATLLATCPLPVADVDKVFGIAYHPMRGTLFTAYKDIAGQTIVMKSPARGIRDSGLRLSAAAHRRGKSPKPAQLKTR